MTGSSKRWMIIFKTKPDRGGRTRKKQQFQCIVYDINEDGAILKALKKLAKTNLELVDLITCEEVEIGGYVDGS